MLWTVYLGFSKVFDKVEQRLLLGKIEQYGTHSTTTRSIHNWLTNCTQWHYNYFSLSGSVEGGGEGRFHACVPLV